MGLRAYAAQFALLDAVHAGATKNGRWTSGSVKRAAKLKEFKLTSHVQSSRKSTVI